MKLLILGFGVVSGVFFSGSNVNAIENLEATENCIMVYVKKDASAPNLTVACDGERVLSHTVKTVDQLADPTQFTNELYQAFQAMVNTTGRKECKPYDLDTVWFASCLTNQ